jgi:hypothetical protein
MSQAVKLMYTVNLNHAIFDPKTKRCETNEETYSSLKEVGQHK